MSERTRILGLNSAVDRVEPAHDLGEFGDVVGAGPTTSPDAANTAVDPVVDHGRFAKGGRGATPLFRIRIPDLSQVWIDDDCRAPAALKGVEGRDNVDGGGAVDAESDDLSRARCRQVDDRGGRVFDRFAGAQSTIRAARPRQDVRRGWLDGGPVPVR